jgi:hypothetical protein
VIFVAVLIAVSFLLVMAAVGPGVVRRASASPSIAGEWTAELSKKSGEVQLQFIRRSDGDGVNTNGQSYAMSELQGLSADLASGAKVDVSFKIVREAGTIDCHGFFAQGRGAGTWTFTANGQFVAVMKSRGYANLTDDQLLRAAFHNLTTKYTDEIRSAGYKDLDFDQLSRAAGHDISLAYIRELQSAGYSGLQMDELIRAHNHEISSQYVSQMRSANLGELTLDGLIRLQNHEITPEFVRELRSEGINDLTADDAIRAKNHDIDGEFIRRAKSQGVTDTSINELIRLKNRGTVK